jgi:hypothetical protein
MGTGKGESDMGRRRISQPTKKLTEAGFVPAVKDKVAGCFRIWTHEDGRKAVVGYGLYTSTGQSSMGTSAQWGYFVTAERERVGG